MASKKAKSMDQRSFCAVNTAGAPGKLCRPTMASPQPGRMIGFARSQGFIRGMSGKKYRLLKSKETSCRIVL